jgi:hypothetical protein
MALRFDCGLAVRRRWPVVGPTVDAAAMRRVARP